jgi:hypothetical protein
MQQKKLKQPNGNGKCEETNQPEKNQKKPTDSNLCNQELSNKYNELLQIK